MTTPLPVNTPVEILKHQFTGWTGTIERLGCLDRLYWIALTHDPDGERLAYRHETGPYVRKELKPLTDPLKGEPSSHPAIRAQGCVPF